MPPTPHCARPTSASQAGAGAGADPQKLKTRLRQNSAEVNLAQFEESSATLKVDAEWLTQALEKAPARGRTAAYRSALTAKSAQLGAVNLAALEELQQASGSVYLDARRPAIWPAVQTLEMPSAASIARRAPSRCRTPGYNKVNEHWPVCSRRCSAAGTRNWCRLAKKFSMPVSGRRAASGKAQCVHPSVVRWRRHSPPRRWCSRFSS